MSQNNTYEPEDQEAGQPIRRADEPFVKKLRKFAIVVIVSVVAGCFMYALFSVFKQPGQTAKQEKHDEATPHVSEVVNSLPDNYTQSQGNAVPKLGPPKPGEMSAAQVEAERKQGFNQQTESQRILDQEAAARVQADIDARKAKVTFPNTQNSLQFNAQTNANNQAESEIANILKNGQTPSRTLKQVNLSRDDANRQDDKSDFTDKKRSTNPYLQQGVITPESPYYISAGTIIPGVLLTGINSDLPGQITGQVSQNVYDTVTGDYLLIPQGTKLVGEYNSVVTYGQERVQIIWTRLIRPNGTSISLEGMPGTDLAGVSGLSDQVNNHWAKILSGALLSSVIGAGAQVAQGSTYNQINPSFSQLATQGAAQNVNQVGQQITQKNLDIQPTLEIRPGFRFNVFVQKDVELPEYTD